ncbi:hypothetical protein GOODEAATRI_003569 [Goodea atripinnis]|uniref:Uncharacterized protein n=1 Tax=Goodea atripinnis TaxID=208336 RepID=A0ABV0PKN6_9TELE
MRSTSCSGYLGGYMCDIYAKTGVKVVDAVTAQCLALREQVAVYEEQLANMETQHKMEVESLLQPDERALATAAIRFGSPDITPALDVKEYHCQLAESLQVQHRGQAGTPVGLTPSGVRMSTGSEVRAVIRLQAAFPGSLSALEWTFLDSLKKNIWSVYI